MVKTETFLEWSHESGSKSEATNMFIAQSNKLVWSLRIVSAFIITLLFILVTCFQMVSTYRFTGVLTQAAVADCCATGLIVANSSQKAGALDGV